MIMLNHCFVVLLLLSLPLSAHAQDIADFSANYQVNVNGFPAGELKRSLSSNEDGTRTFASKSQAKGAVAFFKPDLIEETSIWLQQDNHVRPQSYLYQRTGGKKEKYLSVHFDWQTQQVKIDDKKQVIQLNIEPFTLDKLVYQLALMSDLEQQKTVFSYPVVDKNKIKTYNIVILGTETITTPMGKIEALKLQRMHSSKKQRQTTLWCAPALHYLPVKIEHIEKGGTTFTAELRRLKGIDTASAFDKKVITTNIISSQ